ncbi:MAG: hypothetical protein ACLFUH_10985 [Bacteroidales bacterium]
MYEIESNKNYDIKDKVDIFRKEYPDYVIRVSKFFKKAYKDPTNWKKYAFKYQIKTCKIKNIIGSKKVTAQSFLTIKKQKGL